MADVGRSAGGLVTGLSGASNMIMHSGYDKPVQEVRLADFTARGAKRIRDAGGEKGQRYKVEGQDGFYKITSKGVDRFAWYKSARPV